MKAFPSFAAVGITPEVAFELDEPLSEETDQPLIDDFGNEDDLVDNAPTLKFLLVIRSSDYV